MRTLVLLVAVLPTLAACSLMGLTDIDMPRCQVDRDCLELSNHEGFPTSCLKLACADDGSCALRPDGEEAFDGFDNDCDGLIDEPSVDAVGAVAQTISPRAEVLVEDVTSEAHVTFADDPTDGAVAAWSWDEPGGDPALFARIGTDLVAGQEMSYARGAAEPGGSSTANLQDLDLDPGCYQATESGGIVGADCDFSELAIGVTDTVDLLGERAVLVAAVNSIGCSEGQLRLGYFELGDLPEVILRGPGRRSNSYLGLDHTDDGRCTGGSRPECAATRTSCGLARPAMAVLDRADATTQALVAWIGAGSGRDECGGEPADVEVVVAYLDSGVFREPFGWVTASNEGVPEVLGSTSGGGRPAVAALPGVGYFVGHGDADGALALHFVHAPPDPTDWNGYTCCVEDDTRDECEGQPWSPLCVGDTQFTDRTGLETVSLESSAAFVHFDAIDPAFGGPVDHVAVALGTVGAGSVEVGVAWREGCGASIVFRRLVFVLSGGIPTSIDEVGPAERLAGPASADQPLGPPSLVYVPSGFVVEGFTRDGSAPANSEDRGGWYVAWTEGPVGSGHIIARRVLELDGRALDRAERIDLTRLDLGPDADANAPSLHSTGSGAGFVYHDLGAAALVGGEIAP
jgi:hypothetical protein